MKRVPSGPRSTGGLSALALVLLLAMFAAACGGGDDDGDDGAGGGGGDGGGSQTTEADTGEPVAGGRIVYGLEAESSGGWCLPEAQLAISGIQVARTIYDPLTIPNENGEYVPYLAESVTPNATYDEWTVVLRDGVKFHDGTDLTAEVVKNNLDAFRGKYEGRSPLLFLFVFENIESVDVAGPLTVTITTKTPWVSLPAYLYFNGRFGVLAQAQLDDPDHCDTNLVGTGPFKLEEWKTNDHLTAVKNADYWREGLPYLDEIEYRPIIEGTQRVNAVESGEIDIMHTSSSLSIDDLRDIAESGDLALTEYDQFAEVGYTMLNVSKPPFDNINARLALAHADDRDLEIEVRAAGIPQKASGPFGPGGMGYLEDTGYPEFDLDKAKEYVAKYEEETGEKLTFTYNTGTDATGIESAQFWIEMVEKAGIEVEMKTVEQSALISDALAGNFQATGWRNHPGGDPDTENLWWKSTSAVNFGRISDPEIDRLLEAGRGEPDPEKRVQIYEDLNRRFAEQVYNLWGSWTLWAIAADPGVHGILGADLPDGSKPLPGMANGHAVTGLWKEQ